MRRVWLAGVLFPVLLTSACGGGKVLVGVVLPETGEASAYGTSLRSGIKLAFDEASRTHTAPSGLELIYRDTGSVPATAAAEIEGLYAQGAVLVIGGATSAEAAAAIPVAERRSRVLISPSASAPELGSSGGFFFRVYPSDALEGARAASFLAAERKAAKVLVLKEDNAYTAGILKVFGDELRRRGGSAETVIDVGQEGWERRLAEALGVKPEARKLVGDPAVTGEPVPTPEPEKKPEVAKPDAVYVCGYGEAILASVLELRRAGFAGTICTTSAIGTVDLIWRGGQLMEGLYFPMTRVDLASQTEPTKGFVTSYRAANNDLAPDVYAAHGYDAALITLAALAGNSLDDPTELKARLRSLGGKAGVTGPFLFDQGGNLQRRVRIHCIRGGKVEDCDSAAPAS